MIQWINRSRNGKELPLPGWQEAAAGGWLEEWAMSPMLMNVATRKLGRAVHLPEAGISGAAGSRLSKSAVSRQFKALTEARLAEWMAANLSDLDLLVIRIDGLHMDDTLLMIGAVGVAAGGGKHPLGVVEGATENAATVQALPDNLIRRGLDPEICRLFIVNSAGTLTKAVRRTAQGRYRVPALPGPGSVRKTGLTPGSMPLFAAPCVRPGRTVMPPRLNVFCAIWRGALSPRRRECRRASLKGSTRS